MNSSPEKHAKHRLFCKIEDEQRKITRKNRSEKKKLEKENNKDDKMIDINDSKIKIGIPIGED